MTGVQPLGKDLLAWLDGGMPEGDRKELPSPRKFSEGWVIGEPDLVIKMPQPFAVASVEHQHGFACGKPQHVAEIVALVALERDGFARLEGVIDEQARGAKVQLRHVNVPSSAAF